MPEARKITCVVLEKLWLTPTVIRLRFKPNKDFKFIEGQFLSLNIPHPTQSGEIIKRAYSFSAPYSASGELRSLEGYELCVKHVSGGVGSSYVASLHKGDIFEAKAPYGDFIYEPMPGKNVCFISTGTGVAPFRSIALSQFFKEQAPEKAYSIFGCATEEEIIFPGFFESLGMEAMNCISSPKWNYQGFHGRVTDYLLKLPYQWPWHSTCFYLCGNGQMVDDVKQILKSRGVLDSMIKQEVYFANHFSSQELLKKVA